MKDFLTYVAVTVWKQKGWKGLKIIVDVQEYIT